MTIATITRLRQEIREQQRDAYRDAILDNSERLFFERGIDTVKVSDIAVAAGISVGTVYNHFKNKAEISSEVARRRTDRFLEQLRETCGAGDPLTQLEEFIRRALSWFEHCNKTDFALIALPANSDTFPAVLSAAPLASEAMRVFEGLLAEHMERVIAAGILPADCQVKEVSWYILLLLRAALADWIQAERAELPSARAHLLLRLFLEGVAGQIGVGSRSYG
jgi:AcrR family transcriptional regulator